ncbi:MAG: YcxB family protein [Chloroflexota bacterium]
MKNQELILHYKYTLQDLIQAARIYRATTNDGRIDKVIAVIVFVFAGFVAYGNGFEWWLIPLFLLVPFIWFGLIQTLQIWIAFKRNPDLYSDEYKIVIDSGGVYAKTSNTEAGRQWSAYYKALESDDYFFLVYGKGTHATSVIPKLAFQADEDLNTFEIMIKQKIGEIEQIA